MEYPVKHRCGHEQRHSVYRTFAAEADREVEKLAKRVCTPCWRAKKMAVEDQVVKADEIASDPVPLAALIGSVKQVEWAKTIRATRIASLRRAGRHDVARLATVSEAKWWIDNRGRHDTDLLAFCPPPSLP